MKLIPLTQGLFAKVDDADYEFLSRWKWCAAWAKDTQSFYAMRTYMPDGRRGKKHTIRMHRQILDCVGPVRGDHRNGDTLDNQRENLRVCSHAQNTRNQKLRRTNSSGYKGVTWHKGSRRWRARLMVGGKCISLGGFLDKLVAAEAYNSAAIQYHGEFARLNAMEKLA